uniref:Uncharacterized protein n=1 Tax=Setaria italica TaxID=4555 RepID=K3XU13_SETIT
MCTCGCVQVLLLFDVAEKKGTAHFMPLVASFELFGNIIWG